MRRGTGKRAVLHVANLLVIAFFLKYLRRNSLTPFAWYRVVFGIIVIALALFFRNGG